MTRIRHASDVAHHVPPTTRPERDYPLDVAAIEEYTAGVVRAVTEYRWHPFVYSCHRYHHCPYKAAREAKS